MVANIELVATTPTGIFCDKAYKISMTVMFNIDLQSFLPWSERDPTRLFLICCLRLVLQTQGLSRMRFKGQGNLFDKLRKLEELETVRQ